MPSRRFAGVVTTATASVPVGRPRGFDTIAALNVPV